jgi:hypothetical protein
MLSGLTGRQISLMQNATSSAVKYRPSCHPYFIQDGSARRRLLRVNQDARPVSA